MIPTIVALAAIIASIILGVMLYKRRKKGCNTWSHPVQVEKERLIEKRAVHVRD